MSDHLGRLNLEITVNSFSIATSSHKFALGVKRFALKANETSHSLTTFFRHSIWSVSPPHAVCSSHLRHNLPHPATSRTQLDLQQWNLPTNLSPKEMLLPQCPQKTRKIKESMLAQIIRRQYPTKTYSPQLSYLHWESLRSRRASRLRLEMRSSLPSASYQLSHVTKYGPWLLENLESSR